MSMHDHLAAAAVIAKAGQLAVPGDQIAPSNRCSPMLPSHLEVHNWSIPDNHAMVLDTGCVENNSMTLAQYLE
jgi:hypothetical protein